MKRFIKWLKSEDSEFRTDYRTLVGENIGANIRENQEQTHYLIGSSRISAQNETDLVNAPYNYTVEFENTRDSDGLPKDGPAGWVDL